MEYLYGKLRTYVNPPFRNTAIVDRIFLLLNLEKQPPYSLRGLVHVILMNIKMLRQMVDLVFDTYNSPSLKDLERDERGAEDSIDSYNFGSAQKTHFNFHGLLKLSSFKKWFLRFFMKR